MSVSVYVLKNNKNGRVLFGTSACPEKTYFEIMASLYNKSHPLDSLQKDFLLNEDSLSFKVMKRGLGKRDANTLIAGEIKKAKAKSIEPYNLQHKNAKKSLNKAGERKKKITTSYTLDEDDISWIAIIGEAEGRSASGMLSYFIARIRKEWYV